MSMRRTFKFKKGDLVRVTTDCNGWLSEDVGKEYVVGEVSDKGKCYLDATGWWFPESVLTMVKPFKPEFGYMLRLVQFRDDGSQSYVKDAGQLITEDEFNELWSKFILEEEV